MQISGRITAALLACLMLAGCAGKNTSDNGGTDNTEDTGDNTGYVDTLTPGIDFYGYINGKDLMNMELDAKHKSKGTYDDVIELVDDQVNTMLDEIAASDEDYSKGSYEQIVHDIYHLVEDDYEDNLDNDADDTAVIDGIIEKINSVENVDELKQMWHDLAVDYGLFTFLTSKVTENFYNTSEYIYGLAYVAPVSLEDIKENSILATSNRNEMADKLIIAGVSPDDANNRATNILYTLYEIAGHTDYEILNQEKEPEEYFNVFSNDQVSDMLQNLNTQDLLYSVGYSGNIPETIVIPDPEQLISIDSFVNEDHVQVWKDIAICTLLDSYSSWLPYKYRFSNDEKVVSERMARYIIKTYLNQMVGELYAARYYSEEKRKTITRICDEMKAEYYVLIDNADWLSEEGRTLLKEKLDKMEFFIGADKPHEIDPADAEFIKSSVMQTLMTISSNEVRKQTEDINSVPDRNGFKLMSAHTINACYSRHNNCINITAGITNYPMYDENADYYTNLGRIGSIIGHEISHAFDSEGVLYDAHGDLRPDAMPEADKKAFDEMQKKAIEYYNTFTVLGSHVNGKLTLAENFADISGVQCCLAIAAAPDNQKTVLENYARVWMTLEQDSAAKAKLDTDEHSPDLVRVNAVVACFDEFYDIYGVKEGDPMYVAPGERVRRW